MVPQIVIATEPTELLQSQGEPKFTPIPGTQLLYMTNSRNDIIMEVGQQAYYVLISGRWFRSKSLTGPWSFVPGKSLPADFAKIPAGHPMADLLMSVPSTPQAREAAIANQIPQTATVQRDVQPTPPAYEGGEPQWKPIDGTPLSYAPNTASPVIRVDPKTYYTVQNGVWFSATSPAGPWAVAIMVPAVIYSIPPSSPLHYMTYVRIYGSTPTVVYVGYTPGYYGTVLSSDGVVVYGTGYYYPPYIGPYYYYPPPYYTYGYGAGFTVGFFFGFAMGGGWYGPCCYGGGGGVYISHHNNVNINNSYNRWGGKSTSVTGPGGRNLKATQVGNTTLAKGSGSNNVYAGKDGNVYRRDEGGDWQKYDGKGDGWSDVQRPQRRRRAAFGSCRAARKGRSSDPRAARASTRSTGRPSRAISARSARSRSVSSLAAASRAAAVPAAAGSAAAVAGAAAAAADSLGLQKTASSSVGVARCRGGTGRRHLGEANRGRRAARALHAHRAQAELRPGHVHAGAQPGALRVHRLHRPAGEPGGQVPAQLPDQDGRRSLRRQRRPVVRLHAGLLVAALQQGHLGAVPRDELRARVPPLVPDRLRPLRPEAARGRRRRGPPVERPRRAAVAQLEPRVRRVPAGARRLRA